MRIFVTPAQLVAGELVVRGDEHHYLARVRRARAGDRVELVDGAGRRAAAAITRITDADTALAVETPQAIAALPPLVRALVPLIKGDRMDTCLEKLVEVGVDAITVWPAARSVVRLDPARKPARLAKYQGALQAAARQSGRAQIPAITLADDLAAALAALPAGATRLVLDPASDGPLHVTAAVDITIASGPEGGLAPDELETLARSGFVSVGLGPRILRAETAPLVAIALVRAATRT
ncbi:MAG: 16S rRNA (uracil(1498)-N(3))-methyltransferase [Deltaproteobacteria bacterium]|nr:16S rRNA (uracil(1498)-N(3))-methyltransferase [Deltaproteobacteria bacterium]